MDALCASTLPPPPGPSLSAMLGELRVAELRTVLAAAGIGAGTRSLRKADLLTRVSALIDVRQGHAPERVDAAARLIHAARTIKNGGSDPYGGLAATILAAHAASGSGSGSQSQPASPAPPPPPPPPPPGPGPGPPSAARVLPPMPGDAFASPGAGRGRGVEVPRAAAPAPSPRPRSAAATARGPPAAARVLPPISGDAFAVPGGGAAARPVAAAAGAAAAARAAAAAASAAAARPPPPPPPSSNTSIRCLCGVNTDKGGPMARCAACGVWQHGDCVNAPHTAPASQPAPFTCEACRLADADPFWVSATPADCPGLSGCTGGGGMAGRLAWRGPPAAAAPGADPGSGVVCADWSFTLSAAALTALRASPDRLRLRLACLALGDGPAWPAAVHGGYGGGPGPGGGGVPGRVHWPRFADVRVNNGALPLPHRRHPHDPLAAKGRDAPIDVPAHLLRVGVNRLYLAGVEPPARPFAGVARVVAGVPLASLIATPPPVEPLPAALARVRSAVAGDDPDLVVDSCPLSLRCPLSGGRLVTPVRLGGAGRAATRGLLAFDWASYLAMAARSRRWVCPHSMQEAPVRALVGDGFISAVLRALKESPDVSEVEVGADGRWRVDGGSPWRSVLEGEEGGGGAQAAAAPAARVKAEPGPAPAAPAAAPAPPPPPPSDFILISSGSEDEEDVPLAARGAARGAPTRRTSAGGGASAPAAAAAARPPIRVALPPRARPAVDAAAATAAAAAEARAREGAAMQRLLTSFVSALTEAASPDKGVTVAAAAAQLVAAGTASPGRAAALAGRAWDAAESTLRAGQGGGGGGGAERAAATAAAVAARARLGDAAVRARVQGMAVGAAAARAGVEPPGRG